MKNLETAVNRLGDEKEQLISSIKRTLSQVDELSGMDTNWANWVPYVPNMSVNELTELLDFVKQAVENGKLIRETYELSYELKTSGLLGEAKLAMLDEFERLAGTGDNNLNWNFRAFVLQETRDMEETKSLLPELKGLVSIARPGGLLDGFTLSFREKMPNQSSELIGVPTEKDFLELTIGQKRELIEAIKDHTQMRLEMMSAEEKDKAKKSLLKQKAILPKNWLTKLQGKNWQEDLPKILEEPPQLEKLREKWQKLQADGRLMDISQYEKAKPRLLSAAEFLACDQKKRKAEIDRIKEVIKKYPHWLRKIEQELRQQEQEKVIAIKQSLANLTKEKQAAKAKQKKTWVRGDELTAARAKFDKKQEDISRRANALSLARQWECSAGLAA